MNWTNLDSVYFIGAGGIGMSALARYFVSQGKRVAGYDRVSTALTDKLSREGVVINFEDKPVLIPEAFRNPERTLVIYTPAVPKNHQQLNYFRNHGFRVIKRAAALGEIFNAGRGIGVAGTHGKTSISTMLAHIVHKSNLGCNAFLGGICKNTGSNLLLDPASRLIIAEADEFDRSFLSLFPEIAVVSSMDADHLDIYHTKENVRKGFESFIAQIREKGKLIHKFGLSPEIPAHVETFTYSLEDSRSDYYALEMVPMGIGTQFSMVTPTGIIPNLPLRLPGRLNVENAVAAVAVAHQLGLTPDTIALNLSDYQGVERRFDVKVYNDKRIYIDDYAHHPEEIRAFLSSVRRLFPGKKLTGIFQPHLFSRTRDFAQPFAKSLELLDVLILMEIYPAREEPVPGVTSALIFDEVNMNEKYRVSGEQVMKVLMEQEPVLLVTMGAGDINQFVSPIKNWMERR
ncbi:MAG: UDP-N-acetylmuramate--L-alanine ligase [Bacteroidales bacterium]